MREIRSIPLQQIKTDPGQPRKEFNEEALQELAQSIKQNGLLQPIVVRKDGTGYIIVAGERCYRAVRSLGLPAIECIIYNGSSAKELQQKRVAALC